MSYLNRVKPILPPKKKQKEFSVPKAPKLPKELTEEEIKEQEKNLEKLWYHVHGHKMETPLPKRKVRKR